MENENLGKQVETLVKIKNSASLDSDKKIYMSCILSEIQQSLIDIEDKINTLYENSTKDDTDYNKLIKEKAIDVKFERNFLEAFGPYMVLFNLVQT